ncbi:hypothetical protein KY289_036140 [Solanum tuberosum]|nr:hypothetical protein KY289_036140 [Solanum tuberosum]
MQASVISIFDVLQALKLLQSLLYPVIQIKYVVDYAVGFEETLQWNLEEQSNRIVSLPTP